MADREELLSARRALFGAKVRLMRLTRGWSQEYFCELKQHPMNLSWIRNIEEGRDAACWMTVKKVAAMLDVSPGEFADCAQTEEEFERKRMIWERLKRKALTTFGTALPTERDAMSKILPHPAEAFPLCDYLQEEMKVRGWTAANVTRGTWMSKESLQEILNGSSIDMRDADVLGAAFGVSAGLFLHLQMAYDKWIDALAKAGETVQQEKRNRRFDRPAPEEPA